MLQLSNILGIVCEVNGRVATKTVGDTKASPAANQRVTAMTGLALLVLFTAEVITTLLLGSLFSAHFFVGMLLIGPVCLKIGSTVWRFLRYYTGSAPYVRKGPPPLLHRVLGPLLILATAGVLGTGVILAVTGPDLQWQKLHQRIFYLWVLIVIVHAVHYVPKLPQLLKDNPADRLVQAVSRSRSRWLLLAGSLIAGLILAILTYHLRARWGDWGGNIL